jgi:hypothetical protein
MLALTGGFKTRDEERSFSIPLYISVVLIFNRLFEFFSSEIFKMSSVEQKKTVCAGE